MDDGTRITPEVEAFLRAARAREVDKCHSMLVSNPALINSIEAGGYCALHFAAFNGDIALLEMLLAHTPKPNLSLQNYDGNTPMMMAAKVKHHSAIKLLVDAGADVNFKGKGGVTAAHHAAMMGNIATIRFLVECGAKLSEVPSECGSVLHWACHSGNTTAVGELLCTYGLPVDLVDTHGGTPLFVAAHMNKGDIVQFLLEHGANPRHVVPDGSTPLHIAVEHGTMDDVKALLAFGADPAAADKEGATPVSIAATKGKQERIKELAKPRPEAAKRLEDAARLKAHGNKVFAEGENVKAAKFYTVAISLDPTNHVYFSNRSACYFNSKNYVDAYFDASRCVALNKAFVRGYFRKAAALRALGDPVGAEAVVIQGLAIDPKNEDLKTLHQELRSNSAK